MERENKSLMNMTYNELRNYAKNKNINGYTKYRTKQSLIDCIRKDKELMQLPLPYELYVKQLTKEQLLKELNIKT